ncbi:unnamed protein product [Anisakis simplex]|uniref:EGF-like domain-containing protein n=1 Tax=Anisakis simplex TaxID=6269 RepID=A0A0M3JS58_ANISI|nr:unnamed protein product [Anisakis simplex]
MLLNDSESSYENTDQLLTNHMNFMIISLPSTSYHHNEEDDTADKSMTAAPQYDCSPHYFLLLCTLIFCFTTGSDAFTKRMSSACEMNKDCNKYTCDVENKFHSPKDYFRKPGRSIFTLPCKCQSDWKAHFCRNSGRYRLTPIGKEDTLPSICICRQFSDGGGSCQQFMTQCFSSPKPDEPCYCCFNQPGLYCNQLQCSKRQPEFGPKANTTCVCHLPAFYPYHICNQEDLLDATSTGNNNGETSNLFDWRTRQNSSMIGIYNGQYGEQHSMDVRQSKKLLLLGIELSSGTAFAIVLSLLGLVALMTTLLLVLRSYRLHRQRHQNDLRRNNAQTILLQQRADDDKYLP